MELGVLVGEDCDVLFLAFDCVLEVPHFLILGFGFFVEVMPFLGGVGPERLEGVVEDLFVEVFGDIGPGSVVFEPISGELGNMLRGFLMV